VTDRSHQAEAASAESYFNRDRADLRITPALLAPRRTCPRAREVVLDVPAVGEAHALGMTGRNRFERGHPDQRIEDLDERLVDRLPIGRRVSMQHGYTSPVGSMETSEPL
jgi:hypothetical protein